MNSKLTWTGKKRRNGKEISVYNDEFSSNQSHINIKKVDNRYAIISSHIFINEIYDYFYSHTSLKKVSRKDKLLCKSNKKGKILINSDNQTPERLSFKPKGDITAKTNFKVSK